MSRVTWIARALILSGMGLAWAREGVAQNGAEGGGYDRIWGLSELYANDANPVVQSVRFVGRFQQDYAAVDADQGSLHEWNVRRLRLGAEVGMFGEVTLHGEADLNPQERDPLYLRITDMYVEWSRGDGPALTLGKQGVPFTIDGSTSSKELLTLERNNLSNNLWFPQEYLPGLSASGAHAPWTYRLGAYSAGRANREFGEFNGSVLGLIALGRDLGELLGAATAVVSASYAYQSPDPDNTFTRPLQHSVSTNLRLDASRWGVRADVSAGFGYLGQSDLWGMMVMPFVNLSPSLQFVTRYTLVDATEENGVSLTNYENRVVSQRGDRYQEGYWGVNYYLYGHRLKLQSGLEVGDMSDQAADGGAYSGVSWTTGLRIGW